MNRLNKQVRDFLNLSHVVCSTGNMQAHWTAPWMNSTCETHCVSVLVCTLVHLDVVYRGPAGYVSHDCA